jgi:hypothetical protein
MKLELRRRQSSAHATFGKDVDFHAGVYQDAPPNVESRSRGIIVRTSES